MKDLIKYLFDANSMDDLILFFMLFCLTILFTLTGQFTMADRMATLFTGGALAYLKKK